ncbi:methyl-accepting chemotaxis sensory transducer with Cache sensor [Pseudidiomarina planktonica]|uniref:Methyl-accepting chemotaxis sensory transducer with Cache sensor n=1 Tax=Pseudidiomarina planktonica TaxID=1323738 RepID=A0A1Y6EGZ5_9GAMM|nr:methyl-accepting chemotaxis protein [Pseudidiomarina planktonica]RUO66138.1 methyl-accepting chemotaxis protein [Pseudidiomarina planktonica]SMQ60190.1 methyl-accepting chemotaxis sensory transducer with Cache sensor [Pseudidiomarina planktonica]
MKIIQQLSITQRLVSLLGIAALGTALMVAFMIFILNDLLVEEEKRKLNAVLDTAHTIVSHYHQEYQNGNLSESEARSEAYARLDSIRYEGVEYVFTLNRDGVLVQHPFSKQLVGQDVTNYEDPEGTRLFQEMVQKARSAGRATVEYIWQKGSNADDLVPKISRIRVFEPWNLIMGTGQYTDNITSMLWQEFFKLAGLAAVLAVPLLFVFVLIIRSITRPLKTINNAMFDIAEGEGDLTQRLDDSGSDELAKLATSFNTFVHKIRQLVQSVQECAHSESEAASQLTNLSATSSRQSDDLTAQTSSIATAITELSSSAAEVADHARQAAESANTADEEAGRSAIIVRESVNNIEALTSELGKAGEKARLLQDGSDKIGNILGVIVAIAEQTNLLALNAAIEAARAGDAGRGFAVVADEVRTLATRTQHSTDEISSIVETIQSAIKEVSQIISDVEHRSESTNEEALKAERAISQIQEAVANISSMNIQIAAATDEQSRVTKDLNENITDISDLSHANQEANIKVSEVSRDLSKNSVELGQLVSRFKTK